MASGQTFHGVHGWRLGSGLPVIMQNALAFWRFDDTDLGGLITDSTGRGNHLTRNMIPAASTTAFTIGATNAGTQTCTARLAKWGIWKRTLTSAEKTALLTEGWPFSTTTSLQDASAYFLLDEASAATTFADATGRGNTLTKAAGSGVQVTGPFGGGDKGTQFAGGCYLSRAITTDLRGANATHTIAGWVNLDAKATQQMFWGQFDGANNTGDVVYYHTVHDRYQIDFGNGIDLYRNAVVVQNTFGTVSTGTWRLLIMEYDQATNIMSLSVNNGTADTLSPIQQPDRVAGKLGYGAKFQVNPLYSTTSGWDLVQSRGFASRTNPPDIHIGNAAKTVWGWVKFDDFTTTQTIAGFYDAASNNIDWVIQQSAGLLYFLTGDNATHFDFVNRAVADTNWHLFVAWFDKLGDGKIHLVVDNGTPATPVTPTHTPVAGTADFVMGAAKSGANYAQQLKGTLDAFGVASGVPTATDLNALWNNGNGRVL